MIVAGRVEDTGKVRRQGAGSGKQDTGYRRTGCHAAARWTAGNRQQRAGYWQPPTTNCQPPAWKRNRAHVAARGVTGTCGPRVDLALALLAHAARLTAGAALTDRTVCVYTVNVDVFHRLVIVGD